MIFWQADTLPAAPYQYRGVCTAETVLLHHGPQVIRTGGVPADDQEILVPDEIPAGEDAARRPRRLRLRAVFDADTQVASVAEVVPDDLGQIVESHAQLRKTAAFQQQDDMLQQRAVKQPDHGLGLVCAEGPEARTFAAGENDRFHGFVPLPDTPHRASGFKLPGFRREIRILKHRTEFCREISTGLL